MGKKKLRGFSSSRRRLPLGLLLLILAGIGLSITLWRGGVQFQEYLDHRRKPEILSQAWQNGEYRRTLRLSREILEEAPMKGEILVYAGFSSFYLGISQVSLEDKIPYMKDAVIYLRKALVAEDNPFPEETFYVLGKAYYERGHFYADKAYGYLKRASDKGYQAGDLTEYLASAAYRLKDYETSIAYFQKVAEDMNSPAVYKRIGEIYREQEKWDMAEKAYLTALAESSNPDFTLQVRNDLGQLYQRLKNWEKAIEQYEIILDNDPGEAEIHFQLGEAYYRNSEIARARAEWRNTVRINPDHTGARKRLYN